MNYDSKRIASVLTKFGVAYDSFRVETFHSGHINSTHRVDIRCKGKSDSFVLQRINTYVFRNPIGIMENIDKVTCHIREKLISEGTNPEGRVLEFLKREDGTNYYFEDDANFWRAYRYIDNTITYDQAGDPEVLRNAGYSFGLFQKQLCDFPMSELNDTLPDFHNTPVRMKRFFDACEKDPVGRRKKIEKEIAILEENRPIWSKLEEGRVSGKLPLRVTHNDTKYNNILIDKDTGEAVCVIDLDTVTPGLCAYDFGDAIRFSANSAAEDEPDLSKVSLDLDLYRAFAEGFISACKDFCTPEELDSLALGALTMTFELAGRFLEDYLLGDPYFKTLHDEHNLERGRSQLALALDMKTKFDQMQEINRGIAGLK
ncbi:MAG: aminoglycoside phosphotransferase family protein [Ruminococcaceae bacterium]|nr:aminoglycoside phosphotransferase family protein [Oscillospiraceae bacterium]